MFKVITSSVAPTLTSRSKILAFRVDNQGNDLDRSKSVGITLDPSKGVFDNHVEAARALLESYGVTGPWQCVGDTATGYVFYPYPKESTFCV